MCWTELYSVVLSVQSHYLLLYYFTWDDLARFWNWNWVQQYHFRHGNKSEVLDMQVIWYMVRPQLFKYLKHGSVDLSCVFLKLKIQQVVHEILPVIPSSNKHIRHLIKPCFPARRFKARTKVQPVYWGVPVSLHISSHMTHQRPA